MVNISKWECIFHYNVLLRIDLHGTKNPNHFSFFFLLSQNAVRPNNKSLGLDLNNVIQGQKELDKECLP